MSTTDKNIIPDKDTREAIKEVERIAKEGISGNTVIHKKELTRSDVVKLDEGRPYIDQLQNGQKRLRYRIGNKLYHVLLTDTEEGPVTDVVSDFTDSTIFIFDQGNALSNFSDYILDQGNALSNFSNYILVGTG